jgi:hypothetical protein
MAQTHHVISQPTEVAGGIPQDMGDTQKMLISGTDRLERELEEIHRSRSKSRIEDSKEENNLKSEEISEIENGPKSVGKEEASISMSIGNAKLGK